MLLIEKGIVKGVGIGSRKGLEHLLGKTEAGRKVLGRIGDAMREAGETPGGRVAKHALGQAESAARQKAWDKAVDAVLGEGEHGELFEDSKIWKLNKKEYRLGCEDCTYGEVSGTVVWFRFKEEYRPTYTGMAQQTGKTAERTVYSVALAQFVGIGCNRGSKEPWGLTIRAFGINDASLKDFHAPVLAKDGGREYNPAITARDGRGRELARRRNKPLDEVPVEGDVRAGNRDLLNRLLDQ